MLKCLVTVGTTNTDAAKKIKVRRSMATCWIKENPLASALEEPDDDNVIANASKCALD